MEERCRKRRRRNVVVNAEEEERGAETHTHSVSQIHYADDKRQ